MPAPTRRVIWLLLLVVYAAATFLLVRAHVLRGPIPGQPAPVQLLPLLGRLLLLTWGAYLLFRVGVGKMAGEYMFIFPLMTIIGAFFLTMIGLFFHLPLAGPGTETPIIYGSIYGFINLLILASTSRKMLRPAQAEKPAALAS